MSSKEDKGEDITFTPAMTDALRISCMETSNKSQSSPSKGSSKRRWDNAWIKRGFMIFLGVILQLSGLTYLSSSCHLPCPCAPGSPAYSQEDSPTQPERCFLLPNLLGGGALSFSACHERCYCHDHESNIWSNKMATVTENFSLIKLCIFFYTDRAKSQWSVQ